ncbi:unnamed protein product [Lepidochelys kempii]
MYLQEAGRTFRRDVCGVCKGFFRGKTEHYFPNEIHSMVIYEAHLSLCKLWPLSEAAYPRAETGVSGGNELHSILQPKIYMFKPKLGKESAKLKTASSKVCRFCNCLSCDSVKEELATPQPCDTIGRSLKRAQSVPTSHIFACSHQGTEMISAPPNPDRLPSI